MVVIEYSHQQTKGNKMSYQSTYYCEICDLISLNYLACETCEGKHCEQCGLNIDDKGCELEIIYKP